MAAGGAHRPHHGWDFSHIEGRFEEGQDIPWNYEAIVRRYLSPESRLLDIDTGGGEFLLSLNHPPENTSATEGYPPNVSLCQSLLPPLGIDFREADRSDCLPFDSGSFDLVINRHGRYDARELYRILKPGGCFVTQQVGAENDRELVDLLLPGTKLAFPEQYLEKAVRSFTEAGFEILQSREAFPKSAFTMWARWYGLPGLSNGNFRDSPWNPVSASCAGPKICWTKRA